MSWSAIGRVSGTRKHSFTMTPMRWGMLMAAIIVSTSVLVALLAGLLSA
jgi:hypothetical protein